MRLFAAAILTGIALLTGAAAADERQMTPIPGQLAAVLPTPQGATGCPKGIPFIATNTLKPMSCRQGSSTCPPAYECVRATNGTSFQCCSVR